MSKSRTSAGRPEYYISLDVEMDGPCAGLNSMLQLGAAFYTPSGEYLNGFSWNLFPLPDAKPDPDTMLWWKEQEKEFPGIWEQLMLDRVEPAQAMREFTFKVEAYSGQLKAKPVAVCYPAGYDFSAIYHYLCRFTGKSCLGFSCIDLKTLSMAVLNRGYRDHGKKDMPGHWFSADLPHTHNALDDAVEQGNLFASVMKDMRKLHEQAAVPARTDVGPLADRGRDGT